jgi:DNA invertase Pin-like site-specific DNA recombinase
VVVRSAAAMLSDEYYLRDVRGFAVSVLRTIDALRAAFSITWKISRERIRAGIAEARLKGKHLGRTGDCRKQASQIRKLHRAGVSKAEIARRLDIGRISVRRILIATRTQRRSLDA